MVSFSLNCLLNLFKDFVAKSYSKVLGEKLKWRERSVARGNICCCFLRPSTGACSVLCLPVPATGESSAPGTALPIVST